MDAESFQREAGSYGVDWTVNFVEAPMDAVSDAYANFRKCDIARSASIGSADSVQLPPVGVIVQLTDTEWIILFHQWSRFAEFPILSGINARTMEFGGSDGSPAHTCNLFTPSRPVVRYRVGSVADDDNEYFDVCGTAKSSRPKIRVVSSYGGVFDHYGIRPVFVYLDERRQVVTTAEERDEIVRVDVAVL